MQALKVALMLVGVCALGAAGPITFTISGTASGWVDTIDVNVTPNPVNEIAFSNQAFTLTFATDTTLITGGTSPGTPLLAGVYGVSLDGQIGTFSGPITLFDAQTSSVVGIVENPADPLMSLANAAFASYTMTTSLGPLAVTPTVSQPGHAFPTSFGWFALTSESNVTFSAVTTPEPESIILALFGLIALGGRKLIMRRKSGN